MSQGMGCEMDYRETKNGYFLKQEIKRYERRRKQRLEALERGAKMMTISEVLNHREPFAVFDGVVRFVLFLLFIGALTALAVNWLVGV